ncbi:exodeoxyribonuclease VII large subunit, partial [Acidocella sp.]|uniref:exodeoxyribonuclease VII large subunit n=1 Tax=Acidocella sp. TaxID=50710 RepID=UPI0017AA6505
RTTAQARLLLDRAGAKLPDLPSILGAARQRLDDRGERLALALPNFFTLRRAGLERLAARLVHPRELLARGRNAVALLAQRLAAALPNQLRTRQNAAALLAQRLGAPLPGRLRESRLRLENLAARLESVSYAAVLARGFALVTNAKGTPISSAAQVSPGAALTIKFADGDIAAKAAAKTAQLDLGI